MRLGLDVRLTYYTAGGIARYIRELAQRLPTLAPQHTHVHLYRRGHAENFSTRAQRVNCWTPAHHRLERWALSAEALPHRLDVLHSPDFIPPWRGGRWTVVTVHDLTFWRYPQFLTAESRRYYNGHIRAAVRSAHAISADSFATQADLVNLLNVPPEKITVIHLGLDTAEFRVLPADAVTQTLARWRLPVGYLFFVGTFEPRKNVPGLLRAYAQLRTQWADTPPLVLVGRKGWLFAEAEALVQELHLTSYTHFLPELPNADLPALYNGAGALVLPSHYEGFGFPVLEAMACGTPVVAANRASLPELAGDAALLIDPDNAEEITAAMYRSLTDATLRAGLRERGFVQVQKFKWEKTAEETLRLYERLEIRD